MSHNIQKIDRGFLSGTHTWHGMKQYVLVGHRAVSGQEAAQVVDIPIEKVAAYFRNADGSYIETGASAIVRTDTTPWAVLAPSVGTRYCATPHRDVFNTISEILLASYPLKICGTGTLGGGRTWWIQMVADTYFVKGDPSENELRLCYYQTYGASAHAMFCSRIRIVCQNTLGFAAGDAIAQKMMKRHRHTANAETKINADLGLLAELKMKLKKETEQLNWLAGKPVSVAFIQTFLSEFIPEPKGEDISTKAVNKWTEARKAFGSIFESGQSMTSAASRSRYAVLNAFTNYVDHHSYSRDATDRWMDALDGNRAKQKDAALAYLVAAK